MDNYKDHSSMTAEQQQTDRLCEYNLFTKRMPVIENILKDRLGLQDCITVPVTGSSADDIVLQKTYHIDVIAICTKPSDSTAYIIPIDLKYHYTKSADRAFLSVFYHVKEYGHLTGIIGHTHDTYVYTCLGDILRHCKGDDYWYITDSLSNSAIKHKLCDHMTLAVGINDGMVIDGNYELYSTNKIYNLLASGLHFAIMNDDIVRRHIETKDLLFYNTYINGYWVGVQGTDIKGGGYSNISVDLKDSCDYILED